MKSATRKWILYTLMLLLLVASATAVTISPARKYVDYSEGKTETHTFRILKQGSGEARFVVTAEGAFADAIELKQNIVIIKASEAEKTVTYTITHPKNMKPGLQKTQIRVMELPASDDGVVVIEGDKIITTSKTEDATVAAITSVVHQVEIQVPYDGIYVEGKLFVSPQQLGEPVDFRIPVYNFGTQTVPEIYARIEILGPTNEVIDEIITNQIPLEPKVEKNLKAEWNGAQNKGSYHAKVTVIYGDKRFVLEDTFNIGDMFVRVNDVNVQQFNLGGVAKFNLFVENTWNQELENVYGALSVLDQSGSVISDFKTVSQNLQPNREEVLEAFWDTTGVIEGLYDLRVTLHYAERITEKVVPALVSLDGVEFDISGTGFVVESGGSGMSRDSILVALVMLLVLCNIVVVYIFAIRKKRPPMQPPQQNYYSNWGSQQQGSQNYQPSQNNQQFGGGQR